MSNSEDSFKDFGGDGEAYCILFAIDEKFSEKVDVVAWVKGMGMANGMIINVVSSKRKNVVLMRCCKGGKVYPGEFGMHNHELFDKDHPTRGLSDGVKQLIRDMSKDGCRPCQIMAAIEGIFPDEKVNRRQVYNFRKKLRNEGFSVLGDSSAMDVATKTLSVAKHRRYIIMTDCNQETDVVEANNQDEYNKAVVVINRRWQCFPRVLNYIQKTWLVVDYKFVKVWTNAVFHMGNTATGFKLEYSRQKIGTHYCGFPLNRLKCQVSHTCLQKLNTEWSKAQEWKEETNDRCDHVVYWTCRIPCACALKKAADAGTSITLKHIHPSWATLNIGEQAGTSAPSDVDDDVLYTRQLMEELNECPKAVRRTDKWAMAREAIAREAMANELEQNWHLTSCQEEVSRIRWSGQGFAPDRYWMCAMDLFVVATMNNAIVYYYGVGEENQSLNSSCWIILPVTARGEATCPAYEIGVCHLGIYKHFIWINLNDDFPVPPINNRWTKEHQPRVDGWELPLLPRIQD
ncbi:OLC1v1025438C1 [Oldenlandia corymbosa var. corymbosa]|uniref:OLC1v1025438C1 n=1 Tax=Oldenlandia corymbosa var. corymbosa TaxID=529605 RepID=A0AAV1C7L0_OLDCO|nr:OLC1v1025438C1 [Oldenlandia corymbosa var. corymbosa]